MLGPVSSRTWWSVAVQEGVVGNEVVVQQLFDHRVPPAGDAQIQGVVALGAAVACCSARSAKAEHEVDVGRQPGGLADVRQAAGDPVEQVLEDLGLQAVGLFLGFQDGALGFLEFLGVEAAGVDQGLLLLVVVRDLVQVLLGHLEVVAEDPVEADLQGGDAGGLPLPALQPGQEALAVAGDGAAAVQFGIDARR